MIQVDTSKSRKLNMILLNGDLNFMILNRKLRSFMYYAVSSIFMACQLISNVHNSVVLFSVFFLRNI